MKKSNRMFLRVLAFCLSCVMLFGCLSMGVFAKDYPIHEEGKHYTLVLTTSDEGNDSTITLGIDAEVLSNLLKNRDLTREDMRSFMPELIWNAIENRAVPNSQALIAFMQENGLLSYDTIIGLFPEELVKTFLNGDFIQDALSPDAIKELLEDMDGEVVKELLDGMNPDDFQELLKGFKQEHYDQLVGMLAPEALADCLTKEQCEALVNGEEMKQIISGLTTDQAIEVKAKVDQGAYADVIDILMNYDADGVKNAVKSFVEADPKAIDYSGIDLNTITFDNFSFSTLDFGAINLSIFDFTKIDLSVIDMNKLFELADKDAMTALMKDMSRDLVLRLDRLTMSVNGEEYPVYFVDERDGMYAMDINAAKNALMASIPTMEALQTVAADEEIFGLTMKMVFRGKGVMLPVSLTLKVKFDGDTTQINQYAEKLAEWVKYEIDAMGNQVRLVLTDDGAPATIAGAMNKVLKTTRLSDAEKVDVFSMFDLKGDELIAKLKSFDLSESRLEKVLDKNELSYVAKVRDLTVKVMEKLSSMRPDEFENVCLANLYQANSGKFAVNKSATVSAVPVAERIMQRVDLGMNLTTLVANYPITQTIDFELTVSNVSRVRYYDIEGALIYTTFLPVGASLEFIETNEPALKDKQGTAGWVNMANKETCAVVPNEDLDIIASDKIVPPVPPVPSDPTTDPVKTYKVTFMADGETVAIMQYKHGQTELSFVPEVPEKEGYVGKWEEFALNNEDIVVNAIYTPNTAPVAEYKATFKADGKVVKEITFKAGATTLTGVPTVPAKTGYTGKWADYKLSNADITINAVYTANAYTVNFNSNGGNGNMAAQKMTYDQTATLTKNAFTRTDYTFNGWNTKADGTGTAYTDGQSVKNLVASGTVTLYAQWKKDDKPVAQTYTATFKADGKVVKEIAFKEGDKTLSGIPEVPQKTGYTGKWADYTLGNANLTIEAVYTANTYTVIFNANSGNGTMASQVMTYDMAVALTTNTLTREGYTFEGWNTKADGTGTSYADGASVKNLAESGEVTLYAQWKEASEVTEPPVKNYTGVIVGIIVAFVVIGAGVAVASVLFTKKKYHK